jgi:flagellar basal body-associated protein FliL
MNEEAAGKKSGSMPFLIIAGIILLIIMGVIFAIITMKKSSDKKELETQRKLIDVNWNK